MEWGEEVRKREPVERMSRNGYALGQLGHTHGELVDFIYWFLTFLSGSFLFSFPPFPGPTMVKKKTLQ